MQLGYIHHSGRFDRTPEQLTKGVLAQAALPDVNVIGLTEVANPKRAAALAAGLEGIGWGLANLDHSECAVAYDAEQFEQVHVVEVQVSDVKTWSHSGHPLKPLKATFVLLRSKVDCKTYFFGVEHTPSHVQNGNHWFKNNRARQHRDGLKGTRREMTKLRREWKPNGGRVVSMDLNLNIRLPWVRAYVKSVFPGLKLVTDAHVDPTHDSRVIDIVLIGGRFRALAWFKGRHIKVVKAVDSDHRSVITRLARRVVGKK